MKKIYFALSAALMIAAIPAFADDLSNGSWSTTDGNNTGAPPNGWPSGVFPNQVEPISRATMGAVKRWWERANPTLSTTGSGGHYVITPSNTSYPTAYTQGEVYCGKANFSSLGNDDLNYNGLGAKPIYVAGAASIAKIGANAILSGAQFCAAFDGALNAGGGGFQLLTVTFPNTSNFLQSSNNLSDLNSASMARTNLGLGSAATQNTSAFDAAGAASTAQTNAQNSSAQRSSNLSDLSNATTARSNLGLGSFATKFINGCPSCGPSGIPNDGDIWVTW